MKSCPATCTEPGRRPLQAGNDHEEGGLAGPAGADDGHRLPSRDVDIDAFQDLDRPGAAGQRQRNVVQGDDRFGHDRKSLRRRACLRLCKFLRQYGDPGSTKKGEDS